MSPLLGASVLLLSCIRRAHSLCGGAAEVPGANAAPWHERVRLTQHGGRRQHAAVHRARQLYSDGWRVIVAGEQWRLRWRRCEGKEEASRGNKLVTHKFETQDPPKRRRSSRSSRFMRRRNHRPARGRRGGCGGGSAALHHRARFDLPCANARYRSLSTPQPRPPARAFARASRARARRPPAHPPNHHAARS